MTTSPLKRTGDTVDFSHLRDLPVAERDSALAAVSASLEGKPAQEIAAWAAGAFGTDLIVAASMQDVILPHLFAQLIPVSRMPSTARSCTTATRTCAASCARSTRWHGLWRAGPPG